MISLWEDERNQSSNNNVDGNNHNISDNNNDDGDNDQKKTRLQTFVDLGCGNGLLTYILMSEGYNGIGIDLRKRKIWDLFISKGAKLHGKKKIQSVVNDCYYYHYRDHYYYDNNVVVIDCILLLIIFRSSNITTECYNISKLRLDYWESRG